jgi:hypothetical protein
MPFLSLWAWWLCGTVFLFIPLRHEEHKVDLIKISSFFLLFFFFVGLVALRDYLFYPTKARRTQR